MRFLQVLGVLASILSFSAAAIAATGESGADTLTLGQTVDLAIQANIGLKISQEESRAARSLREVQKSAFLPTVNLRYQYRRNDEAPSVGGFTAGSVNDYNFVASINQPIFSGFELINQYDIAKLGLDVTVLREKLTRQDIVLNAKQLYFSVLKTQKLLKVSEDTVTQIASQKDVAQNFYQVGMTPLNDLLQAQVELANAQQTLVTAQNNLELANANFNLLLRRPLDLPVRIEDVLEHTPWALSMADCLRTAEEKRLESKVARLDVEIARKQVDVTHKDFYPTVSLEGSYFRSGDDPTVSGGEGVSDPDGWNIAAVASWNIWAWGRTTYGVKEKLSRLAQAEHGRTQIQDAIRLEVKQAYIRTKEAEKNIATAVTAITQAKENYRINEERYKQQVATATDLLNAQTLLSTTMTNYYNALYDFKISKATLQRAMGLDVVE
jgi:outer membrane protein